MPSELRTGDGLRRSGLRRLDCVPQNAIYYTSSGYPFEQGEYCLAVDGTIGICCASGACAHPSNDAQNCGGCGISCPPGQTCQNGLCNGVAACAAGHAGSYCNLDAGFSYRCCPGVGCIDTSSDPKNCGACASACVQGQVCDAGACVQ
jgi:hypothetical protein